MGGGVRWWRQRSTAFDGVGDGLRKAMVMQRWLAQQEDKRTVQGEAAEQPASTMRGQEDGAMIG